MNTIQLCVITDEGYTVPTTVMLSSVLLNKHTDTHYIVYCLCNNVSVCLFNKTELSITVVGTVYPSSVMTHN